jgi:hypothetical protein
MDKASRGSGMGTGLLIAALMLSGCAPWQSQQTRLRTDYQHVRGEEQERANYAACVDQGALPGSVQNLQCQLDMAKKEQGAAKPQTQPSGKSP